MSNPSSNTSRVLRMRAPGQDGGGRQIVMAAAAADPLILYLIPRKTRWPYMEI